MSLREQAKQFCLEVAEFRAMRGDKEMAAMWREMAAECEWYERQTLRELLRIRKRFPL